MTEPIQICRGFTDQQWEGLRQRLGKGNDAGDDESAWSCAIEVFERRIRERFLATIDALIKADSRMDVPNSLGQPYDCSTLPEDRNGSAVVPGFAIVALCCLLAETLQGLRGAAVVKPAAYDPTSKSKKIREFLKRRAFGGEFDGVIAGKFVDGVRNGIFHEAETRGWIIRRDQPSGRIVEQRGDVYVLNRTKFYEALKHEFNEYLRELRDPPDNSLRCHFREKMNEIVKRC